MGSGSNKEAVGGPSGPAGKNGLAVVRKADVSSEGCLLARPGAGLAVVAKIVVEGALPMIASNCCE